MHFPACVVAGYLIPRVKHGASLDPFSAGEGKNFFRVERGRRLFRP
jgi:hypothetical protein